MVNRLAYATSPYLLQHAENPVDWWEWTPEAFAEAAGRDVPVFLSVGYAACHWCHVMAHESFEDEATAAYLNANFVSIKVDREERPDIDAVYMEATQAMTGHGGWPMSCALTPDGAPFFAGTYFPRHGRQGMPAFLDVLEALVRTWRDRRADVIKLGSDITGHLRRTDLAGERPSRDLGASAVSALRASFDDRHAGFGGAPKFPPSMVCEFLLRRAARVGDAEALRMAERTLEAMARGGMFDQLGGGFARYSVDERWDVPHFEKMLYDNALLLRVYLHWWRQTGSALARRVTVMTADFMLRELGTAEGGFASSLDADSEGEEGRFYVWTTAQLVEALGPEDGADAARAFGVTAHGNFEGGASTLRRDSDDRRSDLNGTARTDELAERLRVVRETRIRPGRDDKVVAAWNGLAIAALAETGMLLDEPRYLDAARRAADLLLGVHLDREGRLRRVSRDGTAGAPDGVLEDYAAVALGLLVLFGSTGESRWFEAAVGLLAQVTSRFADDRGGFFDTARDAPALIKRPQDPTDNATPSGQSLTLELLVATAALTGDDRYQIAIEALLARLSGLAAAAPRFAGHILTVAEAVADGPRQVAVIGADSDPDRHALAKAAYLMPNPGVVIAQGEPGTTVPTLVAGRGLVSGHAAAYVCHDFVCELPTTDPDSVGRIATR